MPKKSPDSEFIDQLRQAIKYFWQTREAQGQRQGSAGNKDAGNRSNVTGGKQLDGFIELFSNLSRSAGLVDADIHSKETTLPGYYRPTKEWDLVIMKTPELIASIEFKSHIGPSFGNNFNNRVEEALGIATDTLMAFRKGVFGNQHKPWLGYFMILENHEKALTPVTPREPHFPVLPEFKAASYKDRYVEFCRRLVLEQVYDGACLLLSDRESGVKGEFIEPAPDLSFSNFASSLLGKLTGVAKRKDFT